jgi:hypothetical protein
MDHFNLHVVIPSVENVFYDCTVMQPWNFTLTFLQEVSARFADKF